MPTPKKSEGKQDFLKRCTAEVTAEGKKTDQAYAMCNAFWDDAKGQKNTLTLSSPVEFKAGARGTEKKSGFLITAYTGDPIEKYWRPLVIAVKGIRTDAKFPILREHMRDRIVGWSTKAWADDNGFYIQGDFSEKTQDAMEVLDLAIEGFPWQASIGVWPEKVKVLESEKESETVNGQEIQGPAEIWLKSYVRETSFVALGADSNTAAIVMNGDDAGKVPVDIIKNSKDQEAKNMSEKLTRETLDENFKIILTQAPDLVRAIVDKESAEARSAGHSAGIEAGIKQERERVAGILAVENADQKAKLQAITDGVSVDASYKLFFEAEKAARAEAGKNLTDVPDPVESQGKEKAKDGEPGPDFMAAVAEYQKSKPGCTKTEAMKAVIASQPELHAKWLENLNK
uniref:Peptidase n=1 Tax=viral metagenome TaxID=1070528 RepID=A0A6M3XRD6_9ZZZZ